MSLALLRAVKAARDNYMTFCHRHSPVAPSFHFQKGRKADIFEETHTRVTQKLDPSRFFVCFTFIVSPVLQHT